MKPEDLVNDLANRFESKRADFVEGVRVAIHDHIASSGAQCLTLVDESGTRWELAASPSYIKRLVALCKGTKYSGETIDSGLTKPIVAVVTDKFSALYQKNDAEIAAAVLDFIKKDNRFAAELARTIVESAMPATSILKDRLTDVLLTHIHQFLGTSTGSTLSGTLGKTVGGTASGPIAAKIASLIITSFSTHLKVYLGKILATGAIKSTVGIAVKKFLIYAITAALVKAIAIKFGVVITASTVMWVIIPVIVAFIAYEVATFPKHLAKSVSNKLADDLAGKYRSINAEVFEKLAVTLLQEGTRVIAHEIGQDAELRSMLHKLDKSLDEE